MTALSCSLPLDQIRHSANERTCSKNQVQPLDPDDVNSRPRDVVRDVIQVVAGVDDTGLRDAVRGRSDDRHGRRRVGRRIRPHLCYDVHNIDL